MSKTVKQKISEKIQVKRIDFLLEGKMPPRRQDVIVFNKENDFYNGYLQAMEDIIIEVLDGQYAEIGELFRREGK